MSKFKRIVNYFSKTELVLWGSSVFVIVLSYVVFSENDLLTLFASCLGATSLIFNAKGNPFGQILMIVFSVLYGIISFKFRYYGEMITYLCMTAPMAIFAFVSWVTHPYDGNRAQVKINRISKREVVLSSIATALITVAFYFILKAFNTANLLPSTISVTTSFLAVYYTFRRSPFFALFYAANDVVLIVLWILASVENISYLSVVICFVTFLVNDLYGFTALLKMKNAQNKR